MSKKWKIISTIVLVLIIVVSHVVSLFVAGSVVFEYALKAKVPLMDRALTAGINWQEQKLKVATSWFVDLESREQVSVSSHDGLTLCGYQAVQDESDHKWAIFMHGYRGKVTDMTYYAKRFYDKGYNILLPYQRGHGTSQGEYITMGINEKHDLIQWVNHVVAIDPQSEIVIFGASMGAATVMMATGEDLPANVKVAVADCGYTSAYDEFEHLFEHYLGANAGMLLEMTQKFATKRTGVDYAEADSVKALQKSTTPTLFVHGSADDFVPFWMLDEVFDAAVLLEDGETKEKFVVEGAMHMMSGSFATEIYYQKVFEFVEKFVAA